VVLFDEFVSIQVKIENFNEGTKTFIPLFVCVLMKGV